MKPRKIWLELARADFDAGREDWAHRDIKMAVELHYRGGSFDYPSFGQEPGEVIATAQWFALRSLGYPRAIITEMMTDGIMWAPCKS